MDSIIDLLKDDWAKQNPIIKSDRLESLLKYLSNAWVVIRYGPKH